MITDDQKEKLVNQLLEIVVDYSQPPENFKKALDAFFKPATDQLSDRFNDLEETAVKIRTQGISFAGRLSNTFNLLDEVVSDYEEILDYVYRELGFWSSSSGAYDATHKTSDQEVVAREANRNATRRYWLVDQVQDRYGRPGVTSTRYSAHETDSETEAREARTSAILAAVPEWSFAGASTVKKLKEDSDRYKASYASRSYCGVRYG